MKKRRVSKSHIEIDDRKTQARAQIDQDTISEYKELWNEADDSNGEPFNTVPVLFFNSRKYFIADGWHRILSAWDAGRTWVTAEVHEGSQRDALIFSLSANNDHGLRRTKADQRKIATSAIDIMPDASDSEIAKLCAVSRQLVNKIRHEITTESPPDSQPGDDMMDKTLHRSGGEQPETPTKTDTNHPAEPEAVSAPILDTDSQPGGDDDIFAGMGVTTADKLDEPVDPSEDQSPAAEPEREPGQDDEPAPPDPKTTIKLEINKLQKYLEYSVRQADDLNRLKPNERHQSFVLILQELMESLKNWAKE